ncbi:MAG: xylulokinase [Pseudomonadota bacterium]
MYLGIDIGTSAVKAVIADGPERVAATATAPLTVSSPHPGWSEQAPEAWWKATIAAVAELKEHHPGALGAVRGIGLSGQMHGAVVLGGDHRPLRPAILWNDGRSAAVCKDLTEALPAIGDISGAPAMPGFTAPKVLWLAEAEPDVHARIAHILLPKDFVRLKLTGDLATDMADAAGTMWLDQASRRWSETVCAASRTDPAWLPELYEGTAATGTLSRNASDTLGLPPGIPVAAGGGDAAAGAMGIGAIDDGDAFISLGTSGQLFVTTADYRPKPEAALHAYAHCVPGRWFQMAAMLNGASPMQWFAGAVDAKIATLLAEADAAPPDDGLLFLPYLTGERTPHNDARIRGAFYGLTPSTTRGQMMRAVVDAIAYCFADSAAALAAAGTPLRQPAAIGGGTKGASVLQTLADVLDVSVSTYAGADVGPALGAARLAMVASGDVRLQDAAVKPALDCVFEPCAADFDRHRDQLARWRGLYQALKPFAQSAG